MPITHCISSKLRYYLIWLMESSQAASQVFLFATKEMIGWSYVTTG